MYEIFQCKLEHMYGGVNFNPNIVSIAVAELVCMKKYNVLDSPPQ
jgi:hypothetical protein